MKNKSFCGMPPARRRAGFPRARALAALMVATAASCVGCSSQTQDHSQAAAVTARNATLSAAQRQHIHVFVVARSRYRKTIETSGVVDFDNDQATSVLAPFSGPVSRLLVSVGEHVRKGEPLAVVDSPDFAAAISAYSKALVTARNVRRLADVDKDLARHNGVSQREEEQAQTDATNAEADRDAARQALVALNVDAKTIRDIEAGRSVARIEGTIRSPITGTVVEKQITPGQLLQAGTTPCFTVADLSRVWVMAQIFGSDIASVRLRDPAEVVTGIDSKNFPGTVANISASMDPNTRSVVARVVAKNPGEFLKKQMYVRVLIHSSGQSSGLLIPVSAVLRDDENLPFVYVAQPDGSFARRPVTLGYRAGDQYDIPEGLRAGDQVVVEGGIFVQFMQSQ